MNAFTPGPWKQANDFPNAPWLNEIEAPDGTHIVCFGHDYDESGSFGWPDNMSSDNAYAAQKAVAAANARLIAAAPDLYEALRVLGDAFEIWSGDGREVRISRELWAQFQRLAKPALAKARVP